MKYRLITLVIGILLACSNTFAQSPRIDSMYVREDSSQLLLEGYFGPGEGTVYCGDSELRVVSWSDSVVLAVLPRHGRYAAGIITAVTARGDSIDRALAIFHVKRYHSQTSLTFDQFVTSLDIQVRVDFDAILRRKALYSLVGMLDARVYLLYNDVSGWASICYGAVDSLGFLGSMDVVNNQVNAYGRDIHLPAQRVVHDSNGSHLENYVAVYNEISQSFLCDSLYSAQGVDLDSAFRTSRVIIHDAFEAAALPSYPYILHSYAVQLLAPVNGAVLPTAVLKWNTLPKEQSYQVQLSPDSDFSIIVLDTVLRTTRLDTYPVTFGSYYWRVRAVDSGMPTKWSEVWRFTLTDEGVSDAPEATIEVRGPILLTEGEASVEVMDLLGRTVLRRKFAGRLDLRKQGLKAGQYFLQCSAGQRRSLFRLVLP